MTGSVNPFEIIYHSQANLPDVVFLYVNVGGQKSVYKTKDTDLLSPIFLCCKTEIEYEWFLFPGNW